MIEIKILAWWFLVDCLLVGPWWYFSVGRRALRRRREMKRLDF